MKVLHIKLINNQEMFLANVAYYHTMEFDPEVEADIEHNLIG